MYEVWIHLDDDYSFLYDYAATEKDAVELAVEAEAAYHGTARIRKAS